MPHSSRLGLAVLCLGSLVVGCTNNQGERSTVTTAATSATTLGGSSAESTTTPAADEYASAIIDEVVDNPALDGFESKVTNVTDQVGLPGVSLLVVHHGELVQQEAWGEYTLDKVVPVASGSKWLTAATVMTLVDDGLIDLDEPIATYLSTMLERLPENRPVMKITMRQLLSFTSGLVADAKFPCVDDPTSTLTDCAATILRAGIVHQPGEGFRYGSQHMIVAGAIAELVTGTPYAQLFRERIAEPLSMDHTTFVQSGSNGQFENVTNTNPAGKAISTLGDYARFLEMIVHNGVAPDGSRLLTAESVAEMQHNQIAGADYITASPFRVGLLSPYGLGEWLDWTDGDGNALVLSSDGANGFRPWVDKVNDIFGVYLINDQGEGYVEGDPNASADDGGKVHTSGLWVFTDVAEALGGSLPKTFYPDRI